MTLARRMAQWAKNLRYEDLPAKTVQEVKRRVIDSIATGANLPRLSEFKDDFEFCRASWSLVRMHKWPKLRQFRYDLFMQKFLV